MNTIIIQLPLYSDTLLYRYGISIEGQAKQFTFYWNNRTASWHMDIRNEDQTVIVSGVPLVINYPMLADHPMEEFGLTGYFVLLCNIVGVPPAINSDYTVIPSFFTLCYVTITE